MDRTPVITLTTDFGLEDEYTAEMKGVILGRAPAARIIDVTHAIAPQDVAGASRIVDNASRYFPAGTIHVAVVDPGVGSDRLLVLAGARQQLFLAPDNGLLSFLLGQEECAFVHAVTSAELFLRPVSRTFHGRDILAPVAAALANGLPPAEVGPKLDRDTLQRLPVSRGVVAENGGSIRGRVVRVDHFGNLITDIHRDDVAFLTAEDNGPGAFSVNLAGHTISGQAQSYAAAKPGCAVALFGSRDCLEIAVNQGNASHELGVLPGEQVILSANRKTSLYK